MFASPRLLYEIKQWVTENIGFDKNLLFQNLLELNKRKGYPKGLKVRIS
jgi:hypothetical protein